METFVKLLYINIFALNLILASLFASEHKNDCLAPQANADAIQLSAPIDIKNSEPLDLDVNENTKKQSLKLDYKKLFIKGAIAAGSLALAGAVTAAGLWYARPQNELTEDEKRMALSTNKEQPTAAQISHLARYPLLNNLPLLHNILADTSQSPANQFIQIIQHVVNGANLNEPIPAIDLMLQAFGNENIDHTTIASSLLLFGGYSNIVEKTDLIWQLNRSNKQMANIWFPTNEVLNQETDLDIFSRYSRCWLHGKHGGTALHILLRDLNMGNSADIIKKVENFTSTIREFFICNEKIYNAWFKDFQNITFLNLPNNHPFKINRFGNLRDSVLSLYVNIRDNFGKTALHYAASSRNTQLCQMLVEYGADKTIQDNTNKTPSIIYNWEPIVSVYDV